MSIDFPSCFSGRQQAKPRYWRDDARMRSAASTCPTRGLYVKSTATQGGHASTVLVCIASSDSINLVEQPIEPVVEEVRVPIESHRRRRVAEHPLH